jgi:hypothetical protein
VRLVRERNTVTVAYPALPRGPATPPPPPATQQGGPQPVHIPVKRGSDKCHSRSRARFLPHCGRLAQRMHGQSIPPRRPHLDPSLARPCHPHPLLTHLFSITSTTTCWMSGAAVTATTAQHPSRATHSCPKRTITHRMEISASQFCVMVGGKTKNSRASALCPAARPSTPLGVHMYTYV